MIIHIPVDKYKHIGTIMVIAAAAFEVGERGRAVGINLTSTYLELSLGPLFGGFLIQYFGWRSIIIFLIPIQIISPILIKRKTWNEQNNLKKEKINLKGSIPNTNAIG